MMLIRVYGWRNIHTDEWYIGQTSQPMKYRSKGSGQGYKSNTKFWEAIQKYGWESFEQNILRLCTSKEEADYWEKYFIQKYDSVGHGYNMALGGQGTPGVQLSDERKEKISNSLKGKRVGEDNPNYGRHLSEEHKEKLRQANLGKNLSEETKQKISAVLLGRKRPPRSDEWRRNQSKSHLGKPAWNKGKTNCYSDEAIKKMSEAKKGIPLSEEHRKKLSESSTSKKAVCMLNTDGVLLKVYSSIVEARDDTGILAQNISSCCRGERKSAGGYLWRYSA